MNAPQANKRNMYGVMLIFFADNGSVWVAFTRLSDEVSNFIVFVGQIDAEIAKQNLDITGLARIKADLQLVMALIIVKYARKARVWAHDNKSPLENIFNVVKDDFLKGKDADIIGKATAIKTALNDHLADFGPYNITSGNITAIGNAITAFASAKDTPADAEETKKTGTDALPPLFDKADTSLDIIADLLISEYDDTNHSMVLAFIDKHHIRNIGVHHTGIRADIVYSDGSGVARNVQMKIVQLNKTATSDILGIDQIISCKPGTYDFEFSGTGIVTKTITAKLERGHILSLHVEVTKT